jgi:hypothetical protein
VQRASEAIRQLANLLPPTGDYRSFLQDIPVVLEWLDAEFQISTHPADDNSDVKDRLDYAKVG